MLHWRVSRYLLCRFSRARRTDSKDTMIGPEKYLFSKTVPIFSISNSSAGLLGPDNNPLIITIQVLHLHRSAANRHTIITCSVVSTRGAASVNNIITKVKVSRWWCETLSPDDVVTIVTIERQILRKVRVFLLSQPADQKVQHRAIHYRVPNRLVWFYNSLD